MTHFERLLDESPSPRTRALLQAGCSEVPPAGFSEQLLAGVGAAAAVGAATGVAASLSTSAKVGGLASGAAGTSVAGPSLAVLGAKWVAVGVLGGGLLAAGADVAFVPQATPSRAPAAAMSETRPLPPNTSVAPQRALMPAAPVTSSLPVASSAPEPVQVAAPAVASETSRSGELGQEVAIIDRVRAALASGNPSLALSELDSFARAPSTGVFEREARVLRIQALRDAGDVVGALRLTERYLLDYPTDAHAVRLRASSASKQP